MQTLLVNKLAPVIGGFSVKKTKEEVNKYHCHSLNISACQSACDRVVQSEGNSFLVEKVEDIAKYYHRGNQLFFTYDKAQKIIIELQVPKEVKTQEVRRKQIEVIDAQTKATIAAGFTYDGQRFSLSQNAQLNWQRLELLHQAGRFDESQTISTKDNRTYVLKAAKLTAFIQAGQAAIEAALAAGRAKKAALGGGLHAQL